MAVYKATKNKSDSEGKFKATEKRSYDTTMVYDWETRNKESMNILELYRKKVNNGGYLSTDDLDAYRKALDSYVETSNSLRSIAKVFGQGEMDDDKVWNDTIHSLEKNYNSVSKYYSQFDSEKSYNDFQIGWLNPDAETNEETVAARKERFESNAARIEEIKRDLPWYGDTFLPSAIENVFLSDEHVALKAEMEMLEGENRQYQRTQGVLDQYYPVTQNVDFGEASANRDHGNPTRDELAMHDAINDSSTWYYDENDILRDIYGNEIVEGASGKLINPNAQKYAVTDRLGIYLSATEKDIEEYMGTIVSGTWGNVIGDAIDGSWNQLDENEINIYYYLLNTNGQEAADKYLSDMKTELNRREMLKTQEYINNAPLLEQIFLNVASIPMSVLGGVTAFSEDASNLIRGNDINPYSKAHALQNAASDIRGKTATDINNLTGNAALPFVGTTFGDVYQSIMSFGDSAAASFIPGGYVLLGMNAASAEMKDLYERGGSAEQIFAGGLLAGAAEMFFEKVSMGELKKIKNMDTKAVKNFTDGFVRAVVMGGVEASEEMATEIANTISDALVMGSRTDWVDMGTFVKNVVNAGIGGFISGGLGGSIAAKMNNAQYNQQMAKHGQEIIDNGGVDALQQLAMEMSGSNKAIGKLSNKVSAEATAKNVGKLSDLMGDITTAQNRTDITKSLEEKGLSKKDAKRVAEYLNKASQGEYFTEQEAAEAMGNKKIAEVLRDVIADPKSSVNDRAIKLAAARLDKTSRTEQTQQGEEVVTEENTAPAEIENASQSDYEAAVEGKTIRKSTGETVSIKEVASVGNGKMTLRLEDGSEVDSEDIAYSSAGEAYVFETVANLGVDAVEATRLINAFRNSGVEGKAFASGMKLAFEYGYGNFSQQELAQRDFAGDIPRMYINTAYEIGQKMRQQEGQHAVSQNGGEYALKTQKSTAIDSARSNSDAVDLSNDNELSQRVAGLFGAEKYKAIQQYILEVLGDQPITLKDGKQAVVDRSDALHIANKAASKKTAQISKIKELVENADLYAEDKNVEHNKFDYFCYYRADVKYGEDQFPVYLNVGRGKSDGKYHIYDITNKIRDTADRINGLERPKPNEGYALTSGISKTSIRNPGETVNKKVSSKAGGIYYTTKDGKVLPMSQADKNGNLALKDKQSVAVKTTKFLQKLGLGGNYYFFESYVDERGNRVFKDRFGNVQTAPNGLYYSDGDIYIDINAGTDAHSITLRTLSHELTHMIQQWSAAKYKVMADFLAEQYDKEGRNAYEAVKAKQTELSNLRGKPVSFQEAYHEFVADSLSTLFDDGNMYDLLTDLKKKDKTLVDYIKKFFDGLAAKVRELYANTQAETDEGRFVQGLSKDTIYRLQQMFAEALADASGNYAANSTETATSATEVKVQHSTNSYGGVREVLAKKGLDELSKKYGSYFPLSASFDATMKADNTPLVMESVKANSVQRNPKESAFKAGRKSFISTYGVSTSVHIKQMDIDADLYANVANESISKAVGQPNEQSTLDVIPHIRKILENSILLGVERIVHTDKKGTALYGYRLYNLYWYDDGKVKTPHALACTVIQDLNKAEGYVFQNIENVTIDRGLPGTTSGMSSSVNGNTYTVAQLYRTVKKIDRDSGGLKYDTKNRDKYLFSYTTRNDGVAYQDRTAAPSNREILAQALEGVATDVEDFHSVKEYRRIVPLLDAEEAKLSRLNSQIREMSFGKGKRDNDKLFALRLEAKQTQNRIDIYDKQLLRLEATAPLQKVMEREKLKAYKRAEQKGKEAVQKEKERAQARYDELAAKNTASRKKAVEGRHKTEMRHKIQKVVKKLNDLLLNETKDHHIPSGLKKPVAEALDAIDVAMSNPADQIAAINEQIAKATTPEQAAELGAKKAKLEERVERFADKVNALKAAYDAIKQSPDMSASNSYDEVISSKIQEVSELIGETPLYDMSLSQLEAVYDMYRMIAKAISNGNKVFKMARAESISQLGVAVGNEVTAAGGSHTHSVKALDGIKKFDWNNLKPVYAFERIGSQTFTELFNNVRAGEDVWAVDVTEARDFYLDQSRKYGYDQWDMDKRYTFESTTGKSFHLTLEQIMSLYAYSKRDQADDHLRMGGFVFDSAIEVVEKKHGIPVKYTVNTATAYNLSPEILADIVGTLTEEQTEFVDVMQDYLSTVMGSKGDEVSMELYDVKLFNKEKHYFPLKSAKQYMFEQNEVAGEIRLKNSGFSKKTKPHASNPIILSNFMDVWAKHINDMSMYHAFVLPLEDFNRVYHYQSGTGENKDTDSVKGRIQNAYGAQANEYISQLIKDLNGGAITDPREAPAKNLMGKFKKAAVFASLSVVIQQPSAIGRALACIDLHHFIGPKVDRKRHKYLWEELKKYAPVAIIKEMGYFDTNMGRSTQDFIKAKEYTTIGQKAKALVADGNYRDEALSRLPALADELTWCSIWEAVKREMKSKHPEMEVTSEAFMAAAGKRFTEVVTRTQVYDSVLSRSGNMRSKGLFMNMWTAFMAEPTTSINMIEDALVKAGRGDKKYAGRAIRAVLTSVLLNSALVSIVYAMRDDDENETYLEKYLASFTNEMLDGLNPATYYPFLKDVWSSLQGFDIERSDMALITNLVNTLQKLTRAYASDSSDKPGAWWSLADDITSLLGVPFKNIRRDVNGAYNLVETLAKDAGGRTTTWGSLLDSLQEAATNTIPIWGWLPSESKGDKLYDAVVNGDEVYIERLKSSYKSESAYTSAIRKALRENDPRIRVAAQAVVDGKTSERVKIAKEIEAEGHFSLQDIQAAINAEIDKLRKEAKG